MYGRSRCYLCHVGIETIEHLLNSCPIIETLWRCLKQLFRQTDRDNQNINETIRNWRRGGFKCEVLNRAWRLSIRFLLWNIWKERNHRLFQEEEKPLNQVWQNLIENIRQTILVEKWAAEDWKVEGIEAQMLASLNLKPQMLHQNLWKYKTLTPTIEDRWKAPHIGFIDIHIVSICLSE